MGQTEPTLASIKATWAKATPGPWEPALWGMNATVVFREGSRAVIGDAEYHPQSMSNAIAIAAAPSHIDWLVREVERLGKENAILRQALPPFPVRVRYEESQT